MKTARILTSHIALMVTALSMTACAKYMDISDGDEFVPLRGQCFEILWDTEIRNDGDIYVFVPDAEEFGSQPPTDMPADPADKSLHGGLLRKGDRICVFKLLQENLDAGEWQVVAKVLTGPLAGKTIFATALFKLHYPDPPLSITPGPRLRPSP